MCILMHGQHTVVIICAHDTRDVGDNRLRSVGDYGDDAETMTMTTTASQRRVVVGVVNDAS